MQPVGGQAGQAAEQQQHHPHVGQVQFAEAFQGDGDQHHGGAEQQEAEQVQAHRAAAAQVGHEAPGGQAAEQADRQVDQEDPVPAGELHQPAAEGGADQRAEQARQGDEAHDPHQF
ncbi:hypothetical protein D9M71_380510 [compost metagenome]